MLGKIKALLASNDNRSVMLRRNILLSVVLKIIGLATSLLIVPVTLHYLQKEEYGIWMAISSVLYWFSFFDIGLGNGMRNYLTKSISTGHLEMGRAYLSTTLWVLFLIAGALGLVSFFGLNYIDLTKVFNTQAVSDEVLHGVLFTAIAFTLANLVVRNVGFVFVALQKYALNDFLLISGNIISLIVIFVLSKTAEPSLFKVVLVFSATPVCIFLLAAIPLFRHYKGLRPSYRAVDRRLAGGIISKGMGFFVIQITSCLVIFGSSNLFISHYYGPAEVSVYNVAYKYLNLLAVGYAVVLAPMWNAYTDAYVKNDFDWIRHAYNKAFRIWLLTLAGGLLMLLLSGLFYHLWIGMSLKVPIEMSVSVFLYISFFNLNNCATYLINGLNKIRVQIYTSVVVTAIYVVVMYFFGTRLEPQGIVLAMAACYAVMSLIHCYQCHLLINRRARGVWNK